MVGFYLKLKPILRIITYLTYICWEIDNFVIKSDIVRRFVRIFLKKLSYYHDNCSRYFMFGKYNCFVSKARVSACMYFLVHLLLSETISPPPDGRNLLCGGSVDLFWNDPFEKCFCTNFNFLTNTTRHCMSEHCCKLQLKSRGLKGSSQFQWFNQRGEGSKYFKCSGLVCN